MKTELEKCTKDPIYYIEKYVPFMRKDLGMQTGPLLKPQKRMIKSFLKKKKTVVLAPRQSFKTSTTAAYILHYSMFNTCKTSVIVTAKEIIGKEILRNIRLMYDRIPEQMKVGVVQVNKTEIVFENGSRILIIPDSSMVDRLKGLSVNLIYFDEVAWHKNTRDFFDFVYPVMSASNNYRIIMASTPNGFNSFYALWDHAKKKFNSWNAVQVKHWEIPGKDKNWMKYIKKILGKKKFNQEVLGKFTGK